MKDDYQKYIDNFGAAPDDDFYKAMAWGGLKEGDVDEWNKLSAAEKEAINTTVGSKMGGYQGHHFVIDYFYLN